MLRFVVRRRWRDTISGSSGDILETIVADVPALETYVSRGGYGESGFEIGELVGVEVIKLDKTVCKECGHMQTVDR